MNVLMRFAENISYRKRHAIELSKFQDKKSKYMNMSEDEFLLSYTSICTRHEKNKLLLSIISVTFIASIVMNIWHYLYEGVKYIIVSDPNKANSQIQETAIVISMMVIVFLIIFFLVMMYNMVKNLNKSYNEKLLIEELKKKRG